MLVDLLLVLVLEVARLEASRRSLLEFMPTGQC